MNPGDRFYLGCKLYWKYIFQSCTIYRTQVDRLVFEKDELIKTQKKKASKVLKVSKTSKASTLKKQVNQFQSNVESLTAYL